MVFELLWLLNCVHRSLKRDPVSRLYWTTGDGQKFPSLHNLCHILENDHISASQLLRKSLNSAEDGNLEVVIGIIIPIEDDHNMSLYFIGSRATK